MKMKFCNVVSNSFFFRWRMFVCVGTLTSVAVYRSHNCDSCKAATCTTSMVHVNVQELRECREQETVEHRWEPVKMLPVQPEVDYTYI